MQRVLPRDWQHFLSASSLLKRCSQVRMLRGLVAYLTSRAEVIGALRQGALDYAGDPSPDALQSTAIPSVQVHGMHDRTLAEIDQDGFAFAVDPLDRTFFNRRSHKQPRWRYRIEIVLHDQRVCIRKQLLGFPPWRQSFQERFWNCLGAPFYIEAAVLIRLRHVAGIPRLRGIDRAARTLYIDYIAGETLRHCLERAGEMVLNIDCRTHPVLSQLSDTARVRREFALLHKVVGTRYHPQIMDLALAMEHHGVAPLDIHLSNLLIGATSRKVYWIDMEYAWLSTFPGWEQRLRESHRLLEAQLHLEDLPPCQPSS